MSHLTRLITSDSNLTLLYFKQINTCNPQHYLRKPLDMHLFINHMHFLCKILPPPNTNFPRTMLCVLFVTEKGIEIW